jgi:hypothetical protein
LIIRLISLSIIALSVLPAQQDSPAEIARQRQEILDHMMQLDAQRNAPQRWVCAMGKEPESVKEGRAEGDAFMPDAADSCLTALRRIAQVGDLLPMYAKLAKEVGGTEEGYKLLPRYIGSAALANRDSVSVGNGMGALVTPSLAFDAGFTVAYTERVPDKWTSDTKKLKEITEDCLANRRDAGTCFSVGYLYGAHAVPRPAQAIGFECHYGFQDARYRFASIGVASVSPSHVSLPCTPQRPTNPQGRARI